MMIREITVHIHEESVRRIGTLFGDDVSTKEGADDFFNLALATLLSMGEEIKKGRVIVSMNPNAIGGFKGMIFSFPKPEPIHRVK